MARISTYQVDTNVTGADIWIGTDGNDNKKTKNFSPNILAQYLNENEIISTANSLRYRYDTIASGDSRKTGTISFQTEIGANVAFSSITTFILSNKTLGSTTVDAFLNILPNTRILIQNSSNINFFGIYFVNSVTPHLTETGYYVVSLTYVSGNGNLSEDMDYLIHLIEYKTVVAATPTLQIVTNAGDTTTTTVHLDGGALSDSVNEQASFAPALISTVNKNTGSGAEIGSTGYLAMTSDGVSSVTFSSDNITQIIELQAPNKPAGSYTLATTSDIPTIPLVALPFTTDHLTATNNQYVVGNLVWYLGNIYRCIANNDSIIPTSTLYWTNLGAGYPLIQQPTNWSSTSGNNQILNKPTIPTFTSQLTNNSGFLTQQSVLEFANLASFPATGVTNTIYIALDTDIAYYWDGLGYVVITGSTSGITGFGIVNRLAKFTPNGSAIGSSKIIEFSGGTTIINSSNRPFLNGNSIVSIQRPQSQIDFALGNPVLGQVSYLISDNDLAGFEILSKGELAFKAGSSYSNEGIRIYTSGQLKFTQTPATGATSDYILLRDSSGNVKQIAYPTIPAGGLPVGGTAGQVLTKIDATDYNAQWLDEAPAASYTSTIKHKVKLGLAIAKGQAVYVSSADGTNMVVSKASNTSEATSSKTMGLLETGGNTNAQVNVVTEGLLAGLNTSTAVIGDPVWLGTAGNLIYGLTNKPYAPAHLVFIGIVTRVNSNNGEIFVKCQNGFELKEIHDVDLITTTPINGHLLGYNGTLWVNKTIAGWLGYTPANKAGDTFTGNIEAPSMSLNGVNLESLMIAYAVALG